MPPVQYHAVINHEEQYNVLPVGAKIPRGWRSAGLPAGTLREIRAQLVKVWKNRTPGELERVIKEAEAAGKKKG